jgi:hypothetical protein
MMLFLLHIITAGGGHLCWLIILLHHKAKDHFIVNIALAIIAYVETAHPEG